MKFGIAYGYWENDWTCDYPAMTDKVADLGFDVLEIGADHLYHMSDQEIDALRAEGEKRGIEFSTNSGPAKCYDLASPDETIRENGIQYFESILEKMARLGSKILVGAIYSYWPSDFGAYCDKEKAWEHSVAAMKVVARTAEKLNLMISLEVLNRNESYILNDHREALRYINEVGSPNVTILLDTYHMNIEEDNMYDAIVETGDKLTHLHVGECNRKLPGANNSIDWARIGESLRKINYQGDVVMEPFVLNKGQVAHDIRVWRDLSNNATEKDLDERAGKSLEYLKLCFEGEN